MLNDFLPHACSSPAITASTFLGPATISLSRFSARTYTSERPRMMLATVRSMSSAKPSIPDRGTSKTGLRFGSNMDSRRHRNQRVWPKRTEGAYAFHLHIGSSIRQPGHWRTSGDRRRFVQEEPEESQRLGTLH